MAQAKRRKGNGLAERFMVPATVNPALAAPEPAEVSAPLPTFRNAESGKRAIKRYNAAQTVDTAEPIQPKASTRSTPSKSVVELTPDGYVKWWK
jgi:hypothetical protein